MSAGLPWMCSLARKLRGAGASHHRGSLVFKAICHPVSDGASWQSGVPGLDPGKLGPRRLAPSQATHMGTQQALGRGRIAFRAACLALRQQVVRPESCREVLRVDYIRTAEILPGRCFDRNGCEVTAACSTERLRWLAWKSARLWLPEGRARDTMLCDF